MPSVTIRQHWCKRAGELEERKKAVTAPRLVPITDTVTALTEQLAAIRSSMQDADAAAKASLLDRYIDRVLVHFEADPIPEHRRPITLEFIPRNTAENFLPAPMKLSDIRRGTGSSPQPG